MASAVMRTPATSAKATYLRPMASHSCSKLGAEVATLSNQSSARAALKLTTRRSELTTPSNDLPKALGAGQELPALHAHSLVLRAKLLLVPLNGAKQALFEVDLGAVTQQLLGFTHI